MKKVTLKSFLERQRPQFASLAEGWLAAGATSFVVWDGERSLAHWPHDRPPAPPDLKAPLQIETAVSGELRVSGLCGEEATARLAADARLISQLMQLEDELECMTAELIHSEDQLLALYNLSQATRSHLEIAPLAKAITQTIVQMLNVERACLIFKVADGAASVIGYPEMRSGSPGLCHFLEQLLASGAEFLENQKARSSELPDPAYNLLFLPIQTRGALVAGLGLINKVDGDFQTPDLKLARAVAGQTAVHMDNILLYQKSLKQARLQAEMDLAKNVQLQLLPQTPPLVEGLDLYAGSRPALQVGGDFYDFIVESGETFIFTLGDVSGKGLPAALLMAMTRTVLRSRAKSLPAPAPMHMLGEANEDLYDDFTDVGMFATVFVGRYDVGQRCLLYANAGHSPVIYCPAGERARLLVADGPAMGVLPVNLCEDQRVPFHPGDVVVVATDGFNEARNEAGDLFGYEQLLAQVEALSSQPARQIGEALFAAVVDFGRGHLQDDDQTLIVIKGATP